MEAPCALRIGSPDTFLDEARIIPLRPIWPGLIANTLIYALVAFVVFRMYRMFRQHRRLLRGRCPRCGHDLLFDLRPGCSECGWRRRDAPQAASAAPA